MIELRMHRKSPTSRVCLLLSRRFRRQQTRVENSALPSKQRLRLPLLRNLSRILRNECKYVGHLLARLQLIRQLLAIDSPMAQCPRTPTSLILDLIVGIGAGIGVATEVAIREIAGISGISEIRETTMVIPGIEETTAGMKIVGTDENMIVTPMCGTIIARNRLPSLREMCPCRQSRGRFLLV